MTRPSAMTVLDELMTESEVYQRWSRLLADKELRQARQAGQIGFYPLRKGIFYHPTQVVEYLERRRTDPCASDDDPGKSLSLEGDGSNENQDPPTGTSTGMTPEQERSVAEALARKILNGQKNSSRKASSRPRKGAPATRTA